MTVELTGFGFDPHSRRLNIYLNLYFHFFAPLSRHSAVLSNTDTRFPTPTQLCAGYSVKLICFIYLFSREPLTSQQSQIKKDIQAEQIKFELIVQKIFYLTAICNAIE